MRMKQPEIMVRTLRNPFRLGKSAALMGIFTMVTLHALTWFARPIRPPMGTIPHRPLFAVQLNYTPSPRPGIGVQYISGSNAYVSSPKVFYSHDKPDQWQTGIFHLSHILFNGRENAGADFRIVAPGGIAVRDVMVTADSVVGGGKARAGISAQISLGKHSAPSAQVIFGDGIRQVAAGGHTIDSQYRRVIIGGAHAELLTHPGVDYLYFRLSRHSSLFTLHPKTVIVTVVWTANRRPDVWSYKTFSHLKADGITRAEINLEWGMIEPQPGKFQFQTLDRTLRNAARAHVKAIPIFWYSVWQGNPPPWIHRYDVGSTGSPSRVPVWWSRHYRQAYFQFVRKTILHLRRNPGFGGAFLDFGWLDYMWGPPPGHDEVNGYARADVREFHHWLRMRYKTPAAINRKFGCHYVKFNDVPAQAPGQILFPLYQHFRNWSVQETYGKLTAMVRRLTGAPLYYYWGGGYSGAGVAFNIPDTFFQLARRYHVTVCEDCADHTGLMLLFASLARAYRVPLFEEWTPHPGLKAEIAQFLGHYGFEGRQAAGMDFFLYHGGREFDIGFPPYVHALPLLAAMRGRYPAQPVAVYISYHPVFRHPAILTGLSNRVASIWRKWHIAFTVVTDREIHAGVVHLSHFKAVYPMDARHSRILKAYQQHGGHVLRNPAELLRYVHPFVSLTPAYNGLEAVPMVDKRHRTIWVSLAPWWRSHPWHGTITIHLAAMGFTHGRYEIINARNGRRIGASQMGLNLRALLRIAPGDLQEWKIIPIGGK
ncbi:MAG: hypothetical protein ACP5O1_01130 [Phycisphaerae bacterium]